MYSYEIEQLLKFKNNLVTIKEYLKITESPQVDHVKYENNEFTCWTTDNYIFKFKLNKFGNNEKI